MSDEKSADQTPVQPIPGKEIDSAETRTDDQPDSLKPAHSANIGAWRELTSDDLEPVVVAERRGMFGARSQDTTGYGGVVQPVLFPGASPRPYGSFFDEVVDRHRGRRQRGFAGNTLRQGHRHHADHRQSTTLHFHRG